VRRWRSRDCSRCGKRHDLLLHARLVTEFNGVKTLLLTSLVGRKDATLDAARQRLDTVLHRRPQQCCRIELDVFVGLAFQLERYAEGFLDVVEAEAKARSNPALHSSSVEP